MNSEFTLPQTVYKQAYYAVKDLDRLYSRRAELMERVASIGSVNYNFYDQSCAMIVSDNTAGYGISLAVVDERIDAIERAFESIPLRYREGIKDKLVYEVPYAADSCKNTWKKWQQILIYYVAYNLNLI